MWNSRHRWTSMNQNDSKNAFFLWLLSKRHIVVETRRVLIEKRNDLQKKRLLFDVISNHVENKKSKRISLTDEIRSKRKNVEYVKKKHDSTRTCEKKLFNRSFDESVLWNFVIFYRRKFRRFVDSSFRRCVKIRSVASRLSLIFSLFVSLEELFDLRFYFWAFAYHDERQRSEDLL